MPLVLAIEPDPRQAAVVRRVVEEHVRAEFLLVSSKDDAIQAINKHTPDVILTTLLLSPRDETDLIAHLRDRDDAGHLQTLAIPFLADPDAALESRKKKGVLGALRRKSAAAKPEGCALEVFADEVRTYLRHAAEMKAKVAAARVATAPPHIEEFVPPDTFHRTFEPPVASAPSADHTQPTPEPVDLALPESVEHAPPQNVEPIAETIVETSPAHVVPGARAFWSGVSPLLGAGLSTHVEATAAGSAAEEPHSSIEEPVAAPVRDTPPASLWSGVAGRLGAGLHLAIAESASPAAAVADAAARESEADRTEHAIAAQHVAPVADAETAEAVVDVPPVMELVGEEEFASATVPEPAEVVEVRASNIEDALAATAEADVAVEELQAAPDVDFKIVWGQAIETPSLTSAPFPEDPVIERALLPEAPPLRDEIHRPVFAEDPEPLVDAVAAEPAQLGTFAYHDDTVVGETLESASLHEIAPAVEMETSVCAVVDEPIATVFEELHEDGWDLTPPEPLDIVEPEQADWVEPPTDAQGAMDRAAAANLPRVEETAVVFTDVQPLQEADAWHLIRPHPIDAIEVVQEVEARVDRTDLPQFRVDTVSADGEEAVVSQAHIDPAELPAVACADETLADVVGEPEAEQAVSSIEADAPRELFQIQEPVGDTVEPAVQDTVARVVAAEPQPEPALAVVEIAESEPVPLVAEALHLDEAAAGASSTIESDAPLLIDAQEPEAPAPLIAAVQTSAPRPVPAADTVTAETEPVALVAEVLHLDQAATDVSSTIESDAPPLVDAQEPEAPAPLIGAIQPPAPRPAVPAADTVTVERAWLDMAIQALESEIGATRRMGARRRRKDDEAPAVPAPSPRPHADTFWQPAPPSPAANVERVQRKYRAKRKAAPLAAWVRSASPAAAQRKDGKPATPATPADDLRMFLASLNVPQHVAGVMYASGCRIRRVNIVQRPRPRGKKGDPVLILSHKALRQVRKEEAPTAIALARCSAS